MKTMQQKKTRRNFGIRPQKEAQARMGKALKRDGKRMLIGKKEGERERAQAHSKTDSCFHMALSLSVGLSVFSILGILKHFFTAL